MIGEPVVLVVDDHQLVRTSLATALCREGVVAWPCAMTAIEDILAEAARYPAGLVLLDLSLGLDDTGEPIEGVDAIGALRERGWSVLVVSGSGDRRELAAAIAAGAIGLVPKSAPFDELVHKVLDAVAGKPPMSPEARQQWLELNRYYAAETARWQRRLGALSAREREVLDQLAQGHRAAAIAEEFVVTLATVRSQIRSILAKLGVTSQLEAVVLVRDHNRRAPGWRTAGRHARFR